MQIKDLHQHVEFQNQVSIDKRRPRHHHILVVAAVDWHVSEDSVPCSSKRHQHLPVHHDLVDLDAVGAGAQPPKVGVWWRHRSFHAKLKEVLPALCVCDHTTALAPSTSFPFFLIYPGGFAGTSCARTGICILKDNKREPVRIKCQFFLIVVNQWWSRVVLVVIELVCHARQKGFPRVGWH